MFKQENTSPLDFEQLLKRISRFYGKPATGHVRPMASAALGEIAHFVGFDTAALIHLSETGTQRTLACWTDAPSAQNVPIPLSFECPWIVTQVMAGSIPATIDPHTHPEIPDVDRSVCARYGIRSLCAIPLFDETGVIAALVLGGSPPGKELTPKAIDRVQILAELVLNGTLQAEREDRLSDAIEAAEAGLWSLDYSTKTFWATEIARAMHGFDATEEISVDKLLEAVHRDDRELIGQTIEQAGTASMEVRIEYRIVQDDGTIRWMISRGRSYINIPGKPKQLMGVSADVTERRVAEDELRNARALTDAVFNSVPGMLYLYTADGRLVSWNKQHEKLTGYSADEMRQMSNADWFEPEDLQIMKAAWMRVFEEGYGKAELNLKMKDGRLVPYALTGVSLVIDGKPHLVGIGMDISDRIQAERSVAQLRAEMTRVSRVNTLGELTSGLAHELNQPLAAILSNAQAARRFLAAETPDLDEVRAAVEDIIRDDKRAGEIVHGLRALVGKNQSRSELVDLNKLIRAVADLIHGELIASDVPLSLELDPNLPEVLAGQIEIQQVVLNFMLNGIQAQHEVAPDRRLLLVKTWLEPHTIVAAVCDRGAGIPEENLSRVFDPFFTTKNQGLGMGLAICRRIAESYQGRVWAENNPDGGASFYIALPVAKESS